MDLEALRSGDSAAWTELAFEIRTAIRHQVGRDRASFVEDAVQEALVGVWKLVQRDLPHQSLRLLAFAIARNKAKDVHRRMGYLNRWETAMDPTDLVGRIGSGDTPIELRRLRKRIATVGLLYFRKHHPKCEPLLLGRADGMSWDELAEKIGETAVSLRKRWSRCREHLLRHLAVVEGPALRVLSTPASPTGE